MSCTFHTELELVASSDPNLNKPPHPSGSQSARKTNDVRLQDIEEQLEMAESRCNTLKDQLDYMKQVYGVNKSAQNKPKSSASPLKNSSVVLDETSGSSNNDSKSIVTSCSQPNKQKSYQIGTDNTGAAVRTINNILNGITNSVNRLSEIHSQITTPRVKISTGVSPHCPESEGAEAKQKDVATVPELNIENSTVLQLKARGQKRKSVRSAKTSSQHAIKKVSRMERRSRSISTKSTAVLEKRSSTLIRNRILGKMNTKNNNLVEIYHNDALKHSDSDESNLKKSRQQKERFTPRNFKADEGPHVPPLNILRKDEICKSEFTYPYSQAFSCDTPQAPRTTVSCCYSKNYELPTVASRMKQVAKSYLGNLNLKTIPFCAAISTTQSHNIGINIQQVMNIIKNRQPINGISPTLAHNIGLAAEKVNSKHFSMLVSTINSKISHAGSKCPLSNTFLNMQQLQEQARNVPEETIEECDEDEVSDSPQTQTMIITGPSGDMEVKTTKTPSWRVDKSVAAEQCTCVAQPNVAFQQIANRYQRNIRTITENSLNSQIIENQLKKRLRRYKSAKNGLKLEKNNNETQVQTLTGNPETQKEETLNGREKNLKEVLTNLHDDFEQLNKKYEDLSQQSQSGSDEKATKELERLEAELTKKEEEITMVMTLYKEVQALKQQVKQLKEKRSQASLPSKESKETKIKFKEYNNPEAAFHLTKLLKQIQHYQMRYKSNLSQEN